MRGGERGLRARLIREWVHVSWHLKGACSFDEYLGMSALERNLLLRALNWHIEKHNESLEG